MDDQRQDPTGYRIGDKVRLRSGPHAGVRGVVRDAVSGLLEVETHDGSLLQVAPEDVTNYSLAARRAWQTMPKRAGRPRLEEPRKKMVSIRIDVDLWRALSQAAEFGLIPSKEQAVNAWVRDRLDALLKGHTCV